MKKIRAIYKGDIRFNQCPVFELNEKNNKFEMIIDKGFSYFKDVVFSDNNFIVFRIKNDEDIEEINKDNFKLEE